MSGVLPMVHLVRHGETAWTISGQHTGRTDIPLTERGERNAQELSARLKGMTFVNVGSPAWTVSTITRTAPRCPTLPWSRHRRASHPLPGHASVSRNALSSSASMS